MEPQVLSQNERALLRQMLPDGVSGSAELRGQIDDLRSFPSCECGCGSRGFSLAEAEGVDGTQRVVWPVEGEVLDEQDNVIGGLLLFVRDGVIEDLEVFSYGDPIALPSPESVRIRIRPEEVE